MRGAGRGVCTGVCAQNIAAHRSDGLIARVNEQTWPDSKALQRRVVACAGYARSVGTCVKCMRWHRYTDEAQAGALLASFLSIRR